MERHETAYERQNDAGTGAEVDTGLTQPRSRRVPMTDFTETRSMLKKLAVKEGAKTPIGHGAHNMLEQTEHLAKGAEGEQRRHLIANLERQQERLATLAKCRGERS